MTTETFYYITGTLERSIVQTFEDVSGHPLYPRNGTVYLSSSTEVYSNVRFRDRSARRQLNRKLLDRNDAESWTQHRTVGSNHAFVALPVSSSMQEVVDGMFFSGTEVVMDTPVPYSRPLFYEKAPKLRRSIYKWVAEAGMGGFDFSYGQLMGATASIENPHMFSIDVHEYGRIVDLRVWVEILQRSGSGRHPPLGEFGLSLRAPNITFGHAHPLRNYKEDGEEDLYEEPVEFYRDSFILWEPAALFKFFVNSTYGGDDVDIPAPGSDPSLRMPVWDRDGGMRTIFCDGSNVRNPRDVFQVYMKEFPSVKSRGLAAVSPNGQKGGEGEGLMLGNGVPWYTDDDFGYGSASGSPPYGWLTGPGGYSDIGEWDTTGSNNGPETIRPLYPLLDDIYVRKLYQIEGTGFLGRQYYRRWKRWISFRPGLRGKEMNGRWTLMFARDQNGAYIQNLTYMRQWRLEITYEQVAASAVSAIRPKHRRSGGAHVRGPGLMLVSVISGSNDVTPSAGADVERVRADYFLNGIYVPIGGEIERNRTIGLTFDVSSLNRGEFAVYTGSVGVPEYSSSYDHAGIMDVLSPKTLLSSPKTLSAIVRSSVNKQTTEYSARSSLSGTV